MSHSAVSRRSLVLSSTAGLLAGRTAFSQTTSDGLRFTVQSVRTISLQSDRYHGWPTLIRRRSGELLVVCSGGREQHVCPFGRVELLRSSDDGESWTYPRTVLDGSGDDRDAGLVETRRGTLLATTFTSLAYEPQLQKAVAAAEEGQATMSADRLARWLAVHQRIPAGQHEQTLGCWMIRSKDGGRNWSPAYRIPVNSPHGPVELQDGRLLYAGVALWTEERRVGVWTSDDDGHSWQLAAFLPTRDGDDHRSYHELHAVEAADGRLIVHIRNHNAAQNRETLQTHSDDGGKTWVKPYAIGVWGLPSHLLRLQDGRLLMSYGYRRQPYGNQVRISSDSGRSWSEPLAIYDAATSGDLGYPSTAETAPGQLVTVWYEKLRSSPFAQLRMAKWTLG